MSVAEPLQAPVIDGIACSPSSTNVGREFICTATLSGGAPDSYAWSGAANGNKAAYQAFFRSAGSKTISLTVTNSAGSDTDSTTVSVVVVQAPVIYSVDCSPESPTVGESVTCTATLSGDAPDTYYWIGGASSGSSAEYRTSFSSAGSKTVALEVTNVTGSSLGVVRLTVLPPPPAINGITCSPPSPTVDESVTCTATLSGGAPASYAWSGGASSGSGATYTTSFATAGEHTVSLTAINAGGSDSSSRTLTVPPASPWPAQPDSAAAVQASAPRPTSARLARQPSRSRCGAASTATSMRPPEPSSPPPETNGLNSLPMESFAAGIQRPLPLRDIFPWREEKAVMRYSSK